MRRVLWQCRCEPCPGEFFEQLVGNREPKVSSVLVSLLRAGSTDDNCRHGRMGEDELQCRRGQGNAVAIANRTNTVHLLDDRTGCSDIVQVRSGARIGEDAAAVDPGRQHRHAPLLTGGEEALCRRLEELGLVRAGMWESLRGRGFSGEFVREVLGDKAKVQEIPVSPRIWYLASEAYRRDLLSEGQIADRLGMDRVSVRAMLDSTMLDGSGTEALDDLESVPVE